MSYGLAFAGDALAYPRALEPWLQEEVLDELEVLAKDPSLLGDSTPGVDVTYAFNRPDASGAKHYLSLTLARNDVNRTLVVLGIARRTITRPPGS